jgi:hypothetical protein
MFVRSQLAKVLCLLLFIQRTNDAVAFRCVREQFHYLLMQDISSVDMNKLAIVFRHTIDLSSTRYAAVVSVCSLNLQ